MLNLLVHHVTSRLLKVNTVTVEVGFSFIHVYQKHTGIYNENMKILPALFR
jgi:hypothetical protein